MRLNRLIVIILVFSGACVMSACKTGDDESMREINSYYHHGYGQLRVVYLRKSDIINHGHANRAKSGFTIMASCCLLPCQRTI